MAFKLSADQVNSWRLSRHHLANRAGRKDIARVVSEVCGIQAQVLSAAELAIRARVEGVHREDVRSALWRDHTLVKTWCMRGTLHLLASSDLPLYIAALRTKLAEHRDWLVKNIGITAMKADAITDEIGQALARKSMSREELAKEVERRVDLGTEIGSALRSAWGILLRPSAYQGRLAFGESTGVKATFVGPRNWFATWKEPPIEEAFRELFHRFLRAYGPATIGDFGHWWGELRDPDRSILESSQESLAEVEYGGYRGLMLKSDAEEASGLETTRGVHLLPSFDCYAMFYTPRAKFVPEVHRSKIFRKTAGWNYPTLIVDGRAAGIWSLRRRTGRVEVEVGAFRPFNSKEKDWILREAQDVGRFLDSIGEVRFLPAAS